MKKQLLILTALLGMSLMLFSCSDDDTTTGPGDGDDKEYVNSEIKTYVYNEYDLNFADDPVDGTEHQDSLVYEQEADKDGKTAQEYKVYTNAEGSYMEDGTNYYSGENGKLYVHLSFFQKLAGNIEAEGFYLSSIFDSAGDWFLVADANAEQNKPWTIFDQTVTLELPTVGSTQADVVITMQHEGFDAVNSPSNESYSSEKYGMKIAISANVSGIPVTINADGSFWVATEIGIVKNNIETFNLPVIGTEIAGTESILVSYEK